MGIGGHGSQGSGLGTEGQRDGRSSETPRPPAGTSAPRGRGNPRDRGGQVRKAFRGRPTVRCRPSPSHLVEIRQLALREEEQLSKVTQDKVSLAPPREGAVSGPAPEMLTCHSLQTRQVLSRPASTPFGGSCFPNFRMGTTPLPAHWSLSATRPGAGSGLGKGLANGLCLGQRRGTSPDPVPAVAGRCGPAGSICCV